MSFARTQWLSLSVLFLAAPAFQAIAQTNQGAISGNVLDPSGALVPNVAITAKEEATGTTYSTVSSSAGAYAFPNVRIGRYDITATAPGFKAAQLTGVVVVFDDEDAPRGGAFPRCWRRDGSMARRFDSGDADRERAAAARPCARHSDLSPVQIDETLDEREPDAQAGSRSVQASLLLHK